MTENKRINLIYALRDCRDDSYFYIGKTTVGINRPLNHLKKSHNKNVADKIKEINLQGFKVKIDILEENIELSLLPDAEKKWIHYYHSIYILLNKQSLPKDKSKYVKDIDEEETKDFLNKVLDVKNIIYNKRKYLGITQQDLANKSGVSRLTITKIEKGGIINTDNLIKILKVLSSV